MNHIGKREVKRMEQNLERTDILPEPTECMDEFKRKYRLTEEIARGGQGVVYRTQSPRVVVKLELDDEKHFVRANDKSKEHFLSLRLLPIPQNLHITLPVAVTEKYSGYVMQLMDDMVSFQRAFSGAVDKTPLKNPWLDKIAETNSDLAMIFFSLIKRGGIRRMYLAYLKTACLLAGLHEAGLVYCDFSKENVFVSSDQRFCNVWLIDADNLDFQEKTSQHVIYTPGIGAPELIDEAVNKGCTFFSDCHAFASTFFQQITGHHPFEGSLFDEKTEELDDLKQAEYLRDCGEFPWVFDCSDDANAWGGGDVFKNLIHPAVMELFEQTFSANGGLFKRENRPLMAEWAYALAAAWDETVQCPNCQMERFGGEVTCPWCDSVHALVEIKSYYKTDEILWRFVSEIKKDEQIDIPARIVNGFHATDIDDTVFVLTWTDNGLDIQKTKDSLIVEFADSRSERTKSAGFVTDGADIDIFCDGGGATAYKIEVRLKNDA